MLLEIYVLSWTVMEIYEYEYEKEVVNVTSYEKEMVNVMTPLLSDEILLQYFVLLHTKGDLLTYPIDEELDTL